MITLLIESAGIIGIIVAAIMLFYARKRMQESQVSMSQSKNRWHTLKREIETERKEALLKVKDEIYRRRSEFELEVKRDRLELERHQNKVSVKYDTLEKKESQLDELKREAQQQERKLSRMSEVMYTNEEKLKSLYTELISKLENISGYSKDQAKRELSNTLQAEVELTNQKWIQKVEEESRQTAKDKATQIVVSAMQRYTVDQVTPHSSSVVHLPNEEMKGRIIGKEGRNIKSLEMATGMEFVIGDAPEIITVSGFNPIRREIAKRALERLITDGRINPTRIEETVSLCEKELEEIIEEYGKNAVLECNLQGVHPDIVTLLGKLRFRTSFSQNVLDHSLEVGNFARMLAEELGLDGQMALRAGLLHDIGKAVTAEIEGPHAIIGGDIAKRCGEAPEIVNAIAAHHEEVPFMSIYAALVVIADTISASRPGARRETLTAYVKRLEKLEEIANTFNGVKKAYALQAGREIRIIVEEDVLDDDKALVLARDIAKKIEEEMNFPGQIRVNVIREKRAIEYAR
ncbi:MAG: ribonuclease Y [Alteromonas naphthalenivorans]|jgi:ribonuclease Y